MAKLTSPRTDIRSRGLRRPLVVAFGVGVLAALVACVAWLAPDSKGESNKAERKKIIDYEAKLLPIVQEWGKVEIQGMRPAILDLNRSITGPPPDPNDEEDVVVPPEGIAGEARAWQDGLAGLRKRLADLAAPTSLAKTKALFDQAIVRYIDAAKLFEQAADGPVDQRQAGIDKGIDAAQDGARLYNQASMLLQAARRRVGLPITPDFPNHPAGEELVK